MLHYWVRSYAKSAAITPSAAVSLAAHVALCGAAVYGTRHAAAEAEERRTARIVYYPPPDRQPGQRPVQERIQFLEVGAGQQIDGPTGLEGVKRGTADGVETGLDTPRRDQRSQTAFPPNPSTDSVYSILTVDETAARVEGSAAPVYPDELRQNNVEGSVIVRYVIDSTGRAEEATLEVLASTHPLFTKAVRDALPGMRFRAAVVDAHPVRELVEQSFSFKLTIPVAAPTEHTRTKAVP
jgi:TonB family C-terminal domain